jgi:hypothetical protein
VFLNHQRAGAVPRNIHKDRVVLHTCELYLPIQFRTKIANVGFYIGLYEHSRNLDAWLSSRHAADSNSPYLAGYHVLLFLHVDVAEVPDESHDILRFAVFEMLSQWAN